jgi:hypothetical protein
MNALAPIPKEAEALHDREWWRAEAPRLGTDWEGIIATHFDILATCGLIESAPSLFELACRRADAPALRGSRP